MFITFYYGKDRPSLFVDPYQHKSVGVIYCYRHDSEQQFHAFVFYVLTNKAFADIKQFHLNRDSI